MALRLTLRALEARRRLAELGLSQAALAAHCGVELRTVQRWFAGQPMALDVAERLAASVGLGTAELFAGVPTGSLVDNMARLRALHRILSTRDGAVAQLLRALLQSSQNLLDMVVFTAHPLHGYVQRVELGALPRHRFARLRITLTSRREGHFRVLDRAARSVLVERGRGVIRGERALLVEVLHTRSMSAPLSQEGVLELWLWIGPESRELVLCTHGMDAELSLVEAEPCDVFDMALPALQHALCLRPLPSQLRAAGLPLGFDRVLQRDNARCDAPHDDVAELFAAPSDGRDRA